MQTQQILDDYLNDTNQLVKNYTDQLYVDFVRAMTESVQKSPEDFEQFVVIQSQKNEQRLSTLEADMSKAGNTLIKKLEEVNADQESAKLIDLEQDLEQL